MSDTFTQGHALLVGVGADLPRTIDDAVGLANILTDGSRCAYTPGQTQLLTDKNATRTAVIHGLEKLAQTCDTDSTVVIFFSGHGYEVKSSIGNAYFLFPYGYDASRLAETAISGNEFTERLQAIKAKKILVLLDCCHAGGVGDIKAPGLQLTKSPLPAAAQHLFAEGSGRVLIASSRADELSYTGKPYSAFTLALVEALCGRGVAKKDGYVRVADLALYAREVVPQRTSNRQHPILQFAQADNFVLAYYSGGDTQPKELPFTIEPEIEPVPGAGTVLNQNNSVNNPVLSGTFQGPVRIGGNDQITFNQPGWNVHGNVTQAKGDITIIDSSGSNAHQSSVALKKIFTNLAEKIEALPAGDREMAQMLISQAQIQAERLQLGDAMSGTQSDFEKRLKMLSAIAPNIGNQISAELAASSSEIAVVIQNIAKQVQKDIV